MRRSSGSGPHQPDTSRLWPRAFGHRRGLQHHSRAASDALLLSGAYQRGVRTEDYEVIVVDNGSSTPVDSGDYSELEGDFRFLRCRRRGPPRQPAQSTRA